jgi:hypothetical protein
VYDGAAGGLSAEMFIVQPETGLRYMMPSVEKTNLFAHLHLYRLCEVSQLKGAFDREVERS